MALCSHHCTDSNVSKSSAGNSFGQAWIARMKHEYDDNETNETNETRMKRELNAN